MRTNKLIQTDSYKIGHSKMYPKNMSLMFDYVEARKGGLHNFSIFFALQIFIMDFMMEPFTQADIDEAANFYALHFGTDIVFDKEMFQYILDDYNGYFPVTIKAVPEGTRIPEGNVLCTFECTDPKCASIVSFLETMATSYIWYGTTVATNSYAMKQIITKYGKKFATNLDYLPFALHDFGARGVAPGAQRVGSAAHLVNFLGSDSLEGVYTASKYYNSLMPGFSIVASEHSVMGAEGRDGEMIVAQRIFDHYAIDKGAKMIAMVNDTYDMLKHIKDFSEIFKTKYMKTGVRWITRPDSGYPPEVVVQCLDLLWDEIGGYENDKGYKVLHPQVRLIQGDGIDITMLGKVLDAVVNAGFSPENVNFGSGGGLLQKVTRDDLRFAMKASYIEVDGVGRDIFKDPVTQDGDYSKKSKAGRLSLYRDYEGRYITMTDTLRKELKQWPFEEVLVEVYDMFNGKPIIKTYTMDEVRANSEK